MIYLFSLFFSMLSPNEINIGNSLDWLCYNSGTIAMVKITGVKEESFKLMDYKSDATIYATIIEQYKGITPISKDIIIYSRLSYIGRDKWKDKVGKEILVFLKDMMCEQQCVYTMWDDDRGMIDVEFPGNKAFTGDFRILKTKEDIFTYGIDRIEKLKGKKAEPHYLDVPEDTDVYRDLYAGSTCYLVVPDVLYPKSTKGMN